MNKNCEAYWSRVRRSLLNSEEIQQILEESDSDSDAASDIEANNEIEHELSTALTFFYRLYNRSAPYKHRLANNR